MFPTGGVSVRCSDLKCRKATLACLFPFGIEIAMSILTKCEDNLVRNIFTSRRGIVQLRCMILLFSEQLEKKKNLFGCLYLIYPVSRAEGV
jgi:hypothetical protein